MIMKNSLVLMIACLLGQAPAKTFAQQYNLLVGSYTKTANDAGLRVYSFDENTGKSVLKKIYVGPKDPSYLAIAPDNKHVYTANEGDARVSAYSYDSKSGELILLNQQDSNGNAPCYISIDSKQKYAVVANYTGGNLSVFPIQPDGKLAARSQFIQYTGSGPDKDRQTQPHVHSTIFSPDYKQLFVSDLGTDRLNIYQFIDGTDHEPLKKNAQEFVQMPAGGGPRHIDFSKDQKYIYSIQEMTANISVLKYQNGKAQVIQNISMVTPGFKGTIGAADIHTSPDGKFLYTTNRGDANNIAVYRINQQTGKLTMVEIRSTLGKGPRNFTISPNGKFLLVGHQYTNDIVVFKRDKISGKLSDSGERLQANAPVCLKFGAI